MRASTLLFPGLCAAASLPRSCNASTCTSPSKRIEWRSLDEATQKAYTDAVMCMTKKQSQPSLGLSTTLYDDFPYIHFNLDRDIHFVASFLPWHRYFVHLYEVQLRECGYTGPMSYWDWTLDVPDVPSSSIWDPVTGFGGNGQVPEPDSSLKCVADGPFKDLRPSYFGDAYEPHCLGRSFNNGTAEPGDMFQSIYTPAAVQEILEASDYNDFRIKLESGPHGAIHSAIGGDMSPATSPNDPIFFLHHGQIDRLWWLWQQIEPEVRNKDFSGNRYQDDETVQAALDDYMSFFGMADGIMVAEVMTTQNDLLCYTY
ncbi:hypothetical protein B0I35DRAFT_480502 [Stachybotrys elegans]|uniref:Tyrosinase copper-binding domain-containing protein n=1 Tax=Stachybotrys elegans TaxID=80388 RepID=A0A8K0SSN8_9HYPO|nr:hypothetical protein B0I35DRAFT_480502 [Stachybotrys elegans]